MPQEVWPTVAKTVVVNEPIKTPPTPHKVRVYAQDGASLEVYPIDAKEIVAGGEYTLAPPAPPETPSVEGNNSLDSLKKDELIELAESKGIDTKGLTKAEIVNALNAEVDQKLDV